MKVCFFERQRDGENPAGWTVSKHPHLPDGDFGLTEYFWGAVSLWFVDRDEFTTDERQVAYAAFMENT